MCQCGLGRPLSIDTDQPSKRLHLMRTAASYAAGVRREAARALCGPEYCQRLKDGGQVTTSGRARHSQCEICKEHGVRTGFIGAPGACWASSDSPEMGCKSSCFAPVISGMTMFGREPTLPELKHQDVRLGSSLTESSCSARTTFRTRCQPAGSIIKSCSEMQRSTAVEHEVQTATA